MNATDQINELLADLKNRRDEEHKSVDAKFDAAIAALTQARKLLSNEHGRPPLFDHITPSKLDFPGIRASLRLFLENIGESEFSIDDFMKFVEKFVITSDIKRVAISGELWRLTQDGEIVCVKKGRPNIYKKKTQIKRETL